MREKSKYIDDITDSRLRTSRLSKTSGDFTKHLMQRISAENKVLVEERKSERIVKYVIGSFSLLIIGFTVMLGVLSGASRQTADETAGIGFSTVQTSNSLIEQLLFYIQSFFLNALNFFGISLDSGTLNIILIIALLVAVFMAGERLFLRGKLKSSIQLK
jgi:hypothetical protein